MSADVNGRPHVRRKQQARSGATKAALLDACARQVAEVGYAAATTTAIAEAAGVTRGALQYSFEDRIDLMVAVVAEGWRRLVEDLRRDAPTAGTVEQRVAGHVDAMLRAYGSPYAIAAYEVLLGERANPAFLARHDDLLTAAEADLDQLWLNTFADSGASREAILTARRVARAAVLGLIARSLPLGADNSTASAIAPAVAAVLQRANSPEGSS